MSGLNLPQFETKRALIIVNLQNDSLYSKNGVYITKSHGFAGRIKAVVPYFRMLGDVIWVKTEVDPRPSAGTTNLSRVEEEIAKMDKKNRQERQVEEEQLEDDTMEDFPERTQSDQTRTLAYPTYDPTIQDRVLMRQASAKDGAQQRSLNWDVFNDKDDKLEDYFKKPRKGQKSTFMVAGSWGAEIAEGVLPVLDKAKDMVVTKNHYSAFENTSLVMSLRMRLVTDIYLCGCLTNVSVYATAADAVQHGFNVTVVEDCLGYRSEEKHEDAMRQMADIMGVNGIDSEEIIEEAGGKTLPDTEAPTHLSPVADGIALQSLSLGMDPMYRVEETMLIFPPRMKKKLGQTWILSQTLV